jgi:HD-GYP domain-containing protein (c-di-GMP phosphodiesterase class II)
MAEPHAVETAVLDLEIGMYVTSLDRPWSETPFAVEGFYIAGQHHIDALEKYCRYVYVDVYRSRPGSGRRNSRVVGSLLHQPRPKAAARSESVQFRTGGQANVAATLFGQKKLKKYEDTSLLQEELPKAKQACAELTAAMAALVEAVKSGGALDVTGLKQALNPMLESVLRNPDACVWLARGRSEASYEFGHPVGAAIWTVAFGRHLGLPQIELQRMAAGALLFDIGKLKLPRELLAKRERLTREEFQQIKSHVRYGIELLSKTGLLNRTVSDMIEYHHERHGGHGYPNGLHGEDIPVFGRLAGIIDCYDAITSQRHYSRAMSPSHAVKKLYAWRNVDFQAELVEEFIQAVGLYPAGTLVELSNGEVGVVVAGYRTRRLRPQLLLLLDRDKTPLRDARELDLKLFTHAEDGKPLDIATSLEPGAFGVNLEQLFV